jgi:hypothetical protein
MTDIVIKRGSALVLTCVFANADGSAFDLTTISVSGEVRDPRDALVAMLEVLPGETAGVATITVADTSGWPEGLLKADLMMVSAGLPTASKTFSIRVLGAVSYTLPAQPAYDPVTG